MTTTITYQSNGELEKKSTAELVELFNSLSPEKPVKRFSDRKTAIKRVLEQLGQKQGSPKTSPAPKPAPVVTSTTERRVQFDFPKKAHQKNTRQGTKRAKVMELLSRPKGATFDEVMDTIGWDRRTTYEGIKLLHTSVGFGLREDADGRIHLVR